MKAVLTAAVLVPFLIVVPLPDRRAARADEKDTLRSGPVGELRGTLVVPSNLVAGKKAQLWVGIRNVGSASVYFTFDTWNPSFMLEDVTRRKALGRLSAVAVGETHSLREGEQTCPDPADVFMLKPGEELFRGLALDLAGVPAGQHRLSLDRELVRVPPNFSCGPASFYRFTATSLVRVRAALDAKTHP